MSWHRIWAMVLRHTINTKHSWDRLTDMFYWPAMDLFIWGLTGLYLASLSKNSSQYLFVILSGLVFWIIIWRAQHEISVNILQEFWDRNLVNIFSTPLTVWEWMISFAVFGLIKSLISIAFSAVLAFIFYRYNVTTFGFYLFLFIINLLLTGWAGGFLVGGFLIRYGSKIQTIAWAGVSLIAPFSALYYPVSILPDWAQKIAYCLPSTYIFEGIRQLLFTHVITWDKILISFALNALYLLLSVWFFISMFKRSVKLGLGRLI